MSGETRELASPSEGGNLPGPSRLAAVFFERDEDVDAAIRDFLAAASRRGARAAGLVQEHGDGGDIHDIHVRDLTTGARIAIMQDLGPEATGCRVDPRGIAVAAAWLASAIASGPDLVLVNRFCRLESEGGGMLAEIGEAVVQGLPVVVCVPARYRAAWNAFAGGLDAPLRARGADLEAWWAEIAQGA